MPKILIHKNIRLHNVWYSDGYVMFLVKPTERHYRLSSCQSTLSSAIGKEAN